MAALPAAAAASAASAASAPPAPGRHEPLPAAIGLPDLHSLERGPSADTTVLHQVERQFESEVPLIEHMAQAMPAADVVFGGALLLMIVLIHATGMRWLTDFFERRLQRPQVRASTWRPDLLLGMVVMLMLLLHLGEIFAWSAALVWSGLVDNWRAAGFFAANTYTTVGYGSFVLPNGWHMLAPIIAISGLFTFGWTGSVLVEIVRRCQQAKNAAWQARAGSPRQGGADAGRR